MGWLVVWNTATRLNAPVRGVATLTNPEPGPISTVAMDTAFPRDFGDVGTGDTFNLVASVVVFDLEHGRHTMSSFPSKTHFQFSGPIDFGHDAYTLLDVQLVQHFPSAMVTMTDSTKVLFHDVPDSGFVLRLWWNDPWFLGHGIYNKGSS